MEEFILIIILIGFCTITVHWNLFRIEEKIDNLKKSETFESEPE